MLISFQFKNVLSFRDNQVFFLAAGASKKKNGRLYRFKDGLILKFAAIYGANASGKSNFIETM